MMTVFSDWFASAANTGQALGESASRSWRNQSLSAAFLRLIQYTEKNVLLDLGLFIFLGSIIGYAWQRLSKNLNPMERWAGWIALGVVVHPLSWFHSFVLTFPLSALSLDRAITTKNRYSIGLSLLGIICICFVTYHSLGNIGNFAQIISIKSIGVLLTAAAIVIAEKVPVTYSAAVSELTRSSS